MVRVGGGWIRLDEFLETNDPCRGIVLMKLVLRLQKILSFFPRDLFKLDF